MSNIITPWKPGLTASLRLHARRDRAQAYLSVPRTEQAYPTVALDDAIPLSEVKIAELMVSEDPKSRRIALNALNDRMAAFGDLLTGSQTVRLSNSALFPDVKHAGIPEALAMSDITRQQVDMRWVALFSAQDRRIEPWPGVFKISDLYHAISVDEYLPGEAIRFGYFEKAEEWFQHKLFGTGVQWNQLEMAGRYDRAQAIAAMNIKWANKLAKTAYETLTASGYATTTYDATGTSQIEKDIRTINQGMLDLRKAFFESTAKGEHAELHSTSQVEEILQNATYYLLYNDHVAGYEDRVNDALQAKFQKALGGGLVLREVNRPVVPVASPYIPTGGWFLVIANRKNIFSLFRDLRFYDFTDPRIAGVAEGEVGWGAHVFVRGDARQVRLLATS